MDTPKKVRLKPTPSHMNFAVPLELKERFAEVCAEHDISASQKIRQLMNQFVRENCEVKAAH